MSIRKKVIGAIATVSVAALAITGIAVGSASATSKATFVGQAIPAYEAFPVGVPFEYPLMWKSGLNYTGNQDVGFVLTAPDNMYFPSASMRVQTSIDGVNFTNSNPITRCKYRKGTNREILCDGIPTDVWSWTPGVTMKFLVPMQTMPSAKPGMQIKGGAVKGKFKTRTPKKQVIYLDNTLRFEIYLPQ